MALIIILILFTCFVLLLSKYLKYKQKIKTSKIIIVIILLNLTIYGGCIIFVAIKNNKNTIEFNEKIQLYDKDHPDYGLLKEYDALTDEEKRIHDNYFGDGGRTVFTYMVIPILFAVNTFIIIILYFFIDLILKNNKLKEIWNK